MQEGEAREIHNQMERQRRNELKLSFDKLKTVLPELATSDKASKQQILDNAVETVKMIKNTEANIKATWKNLSSKVRGLLGWRKLKDSKERWPPLLDREVSSDTEPDADVVPRYKVRKGTGPEIEVE